MLNLTSSKLVQTLAISVGVAAALVGSMAQTQAHTVSSAIATPQNSLFQVAQASSLSEMEQVVFNRINAYRTSRGLSPLIWSNEVAQQARSHSLDMAKKIVPFGHQGFEQRAKAIDRSVQSHGTGENVGWVMSRTNPDGKVIDAWIKSQKHLNNIAGNFAMTGIGIALSSRGEYYFTQDFVRK
jgi:uncharacterized protein YkwD